jgi:branched-chain amino acid transport system permease protein
MSDRAISVLMPLAIMLGASVAAFAMVGVFGDIGLSNATPLLLGFGLVYGALNALVAVGLILIYRSSRVLNFAQAGFGITALMLYLLLASVWHWNFWLSVLTAVIAAAGVSWGVEVFLVRRFARSPRLVLTVVTIALAQTFGGFTLTMPRLWGFVPDPEDPTGGLASLPAAAPHTPFEHAKLTWNHVVFNGNNLAAVVAAVIVMVAFTVFLRYSRVGTAIRGSSENAERAELLGVNVPNLSSVVWVVAGSLAAVAGILNGMVSNSSIATTAGQGALGGLAGAIGLTTLIRALAAGVIARMDRVPVAVAAAVGMAIIEQGLFVTTQRSDYVNVFLVLVIIASLVTQRSGSGRTETEVSGWESTEEVRSIPFELAHLPQVKAGVRRSLWALGIVIAAWPWVTSPSQTNLGSIYAIYGIIGISLVILTGWGGQISLGHFGFVAVGAAVAGELSAHIGLPFPVAVAGGTLAAGAVAVAIGIPALRIQGLFLAVTTLAFSLAAATWFLHLHWVPNRVDRPVFLWFDSSSDERTYYYVCAAALGLVVFVAQGLRRSRTGRLLIAMRDNPRGAQSYGVSLVRTRLTAFAISGLLAGFAGSLYAFHQNGVGADSYGPEKSIQVFLMAVIGGLGSPYAVLVGAIYLGTTGILIHDGPLLLLTGSIGSLIILLFFPSGLGGFLFRARDAWLRRIAMRNRIFAPSLMGDRLRQGAEAQVNLAAPLEDAAPVEAEYRIESKIGDSGASQLTKLWRY